jgi:putative FmdB family regulatory protein
MPIFDFRCQKCGKEFERLVLGEQEQVSCPECESREINRLVSTFSCTTVQLNKRLKMDSEDKMKKGLKKMKHMKHRKRRIKIL